MKAAKEAFAEFLADISLDSSQIYFVNRIVEYTGLTTGGVEIGMSLITPLLYTGYICAKRTLDTVQEV